MKNEKCTTCRIQTRQDLVIISREGADKTTVPLPEGLEVAIDVTIEGRSEVGRLEIGQDDQGWYFRARGPFRFAFAESGNDGLHFDLESSSGGMMMTVAALEPYMGHYAITKALASIDGCIVALQPYLGVRS